jgi:mRNA-degrading endonuclease toxin of MazEF toxin-antitoxin module
MEKDFEEWHKEKAVLHKKTKIVFFHEREIWRCALGANVGNEQDGKGALFTRPVLILKKFSKTTSWAVPLTTKKKQGSYFYSLSSRVGGRRTTVVSPGAIWIIEAVVGHPCRAGVRRVSGQKLP